MKSKIGIMLLSAIALTLVLGCANLNTGLKGKESLEAKDWLHAGDLAYQVKDYYAAQYFYDLVVQKYPDTYYGKKAKENLGYVSYQKGLLGRTVQKVVDITDPVVDDPASMILQEPR